MNPRLAKISLFLVLTTLLFSCNAIKHLNDDQSLLTKNTIKVDSSVIKDAKVYSQLFQKPNPKVFTIPIGLHIYNLAKQQPDSLRFRWGRQDRYNIQLERYF